MSLPTISIVTPTLNQGGFIRQTIDSVLSQEYPALDYRVLDAGSRDGTLETLASYGGRLAWQSAPDRGQTDAINRGWAAGGGEILAWINSDDFYLPGALAQVGRYFADHPQIDWLYGGCLLVNGKGEQTGRYPAREFDYMLLVRETHNFIPQPAVFLRRQVFQALGALDENLHFVMDFDYWLRAGLRHRAAYLPVPLAALRLHDSAKSVAQLARFAHELVAVYQRYFASPSLPDAIQRVKRRAMSNIYLRGADCAFWGNSLPEARSMALRSFLLRPLRPRRLFVYLLLGAAGRRLAERAQPNPYTAGAALS
jgi:glycosyltransferase involved in cell wall biosynthesis